MRDKTLVIIILVFVAAVLLSAGHVYFRNYYSQKKEEVSQKRNKRSWRPTLRAINDGDVSVE